MFMSLMVIGIAGLTWVFVGWSLAYGGGGDNPIIGGFDQVGLAGTVERLLAEAQSVPDGTLYPTVLDIVFQMAFALITAGIVTGSVAGRMRFGAIALFIGIWSVVVYAPLAHMVWGGEDSLIGGIIGALDFAGGDVVHISSGLTGLVLCLFFGGRKGFGLKTYRAHNVPFVALGAGLLWFGWFGFNGGSAFAADHIAVLAVLNTVVSSAAGMASWMVVDRLATGKCTLVGACTGLVAGLRGGHAGGRLRGAMGRGSHGNRRFAGVLLCDSHLKARLGYDDALDAFGCHGIGGILGGVLTGIFCVPELSPTGSAGSSTRAMRSFLPTRCWAFSLRRRPFSCSMWPSRSW